MPRSFGPAPPPPRAHSYRGVKPLLQGRGLSAELSWCGPPSRCLLKTALPGLWGDVSLNRSGVNRVNPMKTEGFEGKRGDGNRLSLANTLLKAMFIQKPLICNKLHLATHF